METSLALTLVIVFEGIVVHLETSGATVKIRQ